MHEVKTRLKDAHDSFLEHFRQFEIPDYWAFKSYPRIWNLNKMQSCKYLRLLSPESGDCFKVKTDDKVFNFVPESSSFLSHAAYITTDAIKMAMENNITLFRR
jgi:hypothetical protein